jgi:hypothetical protein
VIIIACSCEHWQPYLQGRYLGIDDSLGIIRERSVVHFRTGRVTFREAVDGLCAKIYIYMYVALTKEIRGNLTVYLHLSLE